MNLQKVFKIVDFMQLTIDKASFDREATQLSARGKHRVFFIRLKPFGIIVHLMYGILFLRRLQNTFIFAFLP
jgi:hypothetical protein